MSRGRHWIDGGETKLENLVSLCRHHHTAVHEGGFDVKAFDGGRRFQFYDRSGWPLPDEPPPPPLLTPGAVDSLASDNRRRGIDPDATTPSATWKRASHIPWEERARIQDIVDPS